jgi:hypothetical protein
MGKYVEELRKVVEILSSFDGKPGVRERIRDPMISAGITEVGIRFLRERFGIDEHDAEDFLSVNVWDPGDGGVFLGYSNTTNLYYYVFGEYCETGLRLGVLILTRADMEYWITKWLNSRD